MEKICLCVPARAEYLLTVRLVAGALFGQAGYNVDDIEDGKTALSEACLLLMPDKYEQDDIELTLWSDNGIHAIVSAPEKKAGYMQTDEREFSKFLLEALTDNVEFKKEKGLNSYKLYKAPPA